MMIEVLKSKIHRAVLTDANLHYVGSLSIDEDLMDAAGIIANEKIHVLNVTNGERLVTYAIQAPRGSGAIVLNGAAARRGMAGDILVIVSYAMMDFTEAKSFVPTVVHPAAGNKLP
ncbi:MAG: aspartate 1-decarboxylase [Bacteroidota bacterium]